MFDPKKLPAIQEELENLKKQLTFFYNRIESIELKPKFGFTKEDQDQAAGKVKSRIDDIDKINETIKDFDSEEAFEKLTQLEALDTLFMINDIFFGTLAEVEKITYDYSIYNFERYKNEIVKPLEELNGLFEFIIPNIRSEVSIMEIYYRMPENSEETILPELNEILSILEKNEISLRQFFNGFKHNEKQIAGYNELRTKKNLFSRYQLYEGDPSQYDELNTIIYHICKTLEAFFSELRTEAEFIKIYPQFEEVNERASNPKSQKNVARMAEIFKLQSIFQTWIRIIRKKYSFREEYKKALKLSEDFNVLSKKIVTYNQVFFDTDEKKLSEKFPEESEKKKYDIIMEEVRGCLKEKTIPFDRIEQVFQKLDKKDFHVIVRDKEADDITVTITPTVAEKNDEDLLKKINLIIQEINFWYPQESKLLKFEEIGRFTMKIEANESVDQEAFAKLVDTLDKELDKFFRNGYDQLIHSLNVAMKNLSGILFTKTGRDNLASRMMDKDMWDFYSPMLTRVKRNLAILNSGSPAIMKVNMNKFPFIKGATEELCQILYDLSMRLFILFDCGDRRSTANMMNILSAFNEFYDVSGLVIAFTTYYKQKSIPNLFANEIRIKNVSKNRFVQGKLRILFPAEKRDGKEENLTTFGG